MFLNIIKAKKYDKFFLILMALHVYKTRQMHITSANGMNKWIYGIDKWRNYESLGI